MKSSFPRSLVLCLAVIASSSHAASPDPSLIGCWRAVKITRLVEGGAKVEDKSGRCTLHFTEDVLASSCETTAGIMTTTYRYEIVRPHFYSATMAGSTFKTSLIGSTREYEFHVDGDRLATTTTVQPTDSGSSTATVRVETEAAKMPCPGG